MGMLVINRVRGTHVMTFDGFPQTTFRLSPLLSCVQVEGLNLSCVNELYRSKPERFVLGRGRWFHHGFPGFCLGWDVMETQALTELGSEQPQEICGFGSNGAGI